MGALAVPLMVGGTTLSVLGALQEGEYAKAQGRAQRKINEVVAKQAIAVGQRGALEERRKADLVASRVIALAGGGGGDPTVMNIIADIESEGVYRASVAMYEGEESARKLRTEGEFAEWAGEQASKAAPLKALSTALTGGASVAMYKKKYG